MSVVRWNSQQATADEFNFMNHLELNSLRFNALDELTAEHEYLGSSPEEIFRKSSLSPDCYTSFLATDQENNMSSTTIDISDHSFERPTKQIKTNTWNSQHVHDQVLLAKDYSSSPSSSNLISFANSSSQPTDSRTSCIDLVSPVLVPCKDELLTYEDLTQTYNLDDKNVIYSSKLGGQGTKRSSATAILSRTPSHAQDHVIAERKRRERLTERFIALSAIVPGLKKLDKASVLGDAIKYLKHLQERVKLLEEQIKKKKPAESFVSLNGCQLPAYDDDSSSSDVNSSGCLNKALPEIQARVSEKNVLIRIHCEKQKGFIPKMLTEIEKLHLIVINSNVLSFGDYAIDVTVVAQMDDEFCLTVKDFVRNLRSALH